MTWVPYDWLPTPGADFERDAQKLPGQAASAADRHDEKLKVQRLFLGVG